MNAVLITTPGLRSSQAPMRAGLLVSVSLLAGCTGLQPPPRIAYDDVARPAVLQTDPPPPARIVEIPRPLPLPGQLKPLPPPSKMFPDAADPATRITKANAAARVEPSRDGFLNAVQVYPYSEGALYQAYTAPGQITDIALQPGEQLVGAGPVAAGDTVRWIIGDTESGAGASKRMHILVKPTRPDLITNLIINTDRRTYLLELRSTPSTYMASVSWQYHQDALIALHLQNETAASSAPVEAGIDISKLRFRYRITGDNPPWRPLSAFDDGAKVYIEMPRGLTQGEAPPLFVIGAAGDGQLVNYRVRQNYYIVDRLFGAAELRLGGDRQQIVRIARTDEAAR